MSLTPTSKIPLGFTMPDFVLPDTISNTVVSSDNMKGEKGTLVMFICNHCPYVLHVIQELVKIGYEYINKGIGVVAISSNDIVNFPEDHPDRMQELALSLKFPFPYLFDESQEVALAYDAACTPDFNLFDASGKCVYRGQLDDSRPGNKKPVTGNGLRAALDLVLAGRDVPEQQTPSTGCNIKWKDDKRDKGIGL
ncbi:MAG: thioredoxin family protein [Bacteroidetes bacterium]|jgi:peroxiredoxin|nr:thioredoxin family protein [Bacteroidota bacterium]|tara:strand:- start:1203 stop:1787 length:585 start_codon:yes stop_codon:yes gene_type:complete